MSLKDLDLVYDFRERSQREKDLPAPKFQKTLGYLVFAPKGFPDPISKKLGMP